MDKEFLGVLMNMMVFIPLLGIPLVLLLQKNSSKVIALVISIIPFLISILLYSNYLEFSPLDAEAAGDGFVFKTNYRWFGEQLEQGNWYSRYDIKFMTGMDGISVYLVLLTTLLFPLSIFFSWNSIKKMDKSYYALLLLLETAVLGVFVSLDMVLFYVFFEMGLIPMYFLIGIWGGNDRIKASMKFFLYTLAGSVILLVSLIYLGIDAGMHVNGGNFTTDYLKIRQYTISPDVQKWLFIGFTLSFAIKVPLFPVHTWLPAAHVQAPTAGSVILAGVLLKMGTYGLIRFSLPLFPNASLEYANIMSALGVIGILYGGMVAMVQKDVKKLIAYSSVAHMGFIVLGVFSFTEEALSGAVIQMINHGISTGALFFIIGMIYDRRHTKKIADFQGIAKIMPTFTLFFMIATFSSIGLPGLNGFVGEFLILIGSFSSEYISGSFAIFAAAGVIVAAVYMLWMFRRVMFGELDKEENKKLVDLKPAEVAILVPLTVLMFVFGFYPKPFLKEISRSSDRVAKVIENAHHYNLDAFKKQTADAEVYKMKSKDLK